jgi:hypothetical protein
VYDGNEAVPETISSRVELDAYLRHEPADSPLKQLSTSARQRFLDSLVFGENGGIAGFFYTDIQFELRDAEARALLRLFNTEATWNLISPPQGVVAPLPPNDYKDMWCRSRGTCASETGSICTSNC